MITSVIYGLCFIIILTRKDEGARVMAGICLAYLLLENIALWFISSSPFADISLYLTASWSLDAVLLFCAALIAKGYRQIIVISISVPLMLVQVFSLQYPDIFPVWVYVFSVHDAHKYFIEMFIFVYSWKDNKVIDWFRTGTVTALVLAAHLV